LTARALGREGEGTVLLDRPAGIVGDLPRGWPSGSMKTPEIATPEGLAGLSPEWSRRRSGPCSITSSTSPGLRVLWAKVTPPIRPGPRPRCPRPAAHGPRGRPPCIPLGRKTTSSALLGAGLPSRAPCRTRRAPSQVRHSEGDQSESLSHGLGRRGRGLRQRVREPAAFSASSSAPNASRTRRSAMRREGMRDEVCSRPWVRATGHRPRRSLLEACSC